MESVDTMRERIVELEQENREMSVAIYQYRMVLEHYLSICAAVGADAQPAAEALVKLPRMRVLPRIWRVK